MTIGLLVLENNGRKIEKLVGWLVGEVKVTTISFPRVSDVVVLATSDATAVIRSGRSAKNPDRLIVVVLAGVEVDVKMRLRRHYRRKRSQSNAELPLNFRKCR